MLQFFFPIHGSDLLTLVRVTMGLTACSLLQGHALWGVLCSVSATMTLRDKTIPSSSPTVKQWTVTSAISTITALCAWVLLTQLDRSLMATTASTSIGSSIGSTAVLLTESSSSPYAHIWTKRWLIGQFLEKMTACGILYLLYDDLLVSDHLPDTERGGGRIRRGSLTSKMASSGGIALMEIEVRIRQGRNLVAKDKNLFGKPTTSDPYVQVHLGSTLLGKTPVCPKTLNPVWNRGGAEKGSLIKRTVLEKTTTHHPQLECVIWDRDILSSDDLMGTCVIPLPPSSSTQNVKIVHWYKVQPHGKDKDNKKHHVPNATGELLVEVMVRQKSGM